MPVALKTELDSFCRLCHAKNNNNGNDHDDEHARDWLRDDEHKNTFLSSSNVATTATKESIHAMLSSSTQESANENNRTATMHRMTPHCICH